MKNIFTFIFAIVLSVSAYAQQQDTMYVHKGKSIYEFATQEVDSIIFYKSKSAVASISLHPSSAILPIGNTLTLTETILPATATNKAVLWVSSFPSVATVNGGVVTAVAVGTSTIMAITLDGKRVANCEITAEL